MVDAEPILYWMFLEVAPAGGAAIGGERVLVTTLPLIKQYHKGKYSAEVYGGEFNTAS